MKFTEAQNKTDDEIYDICRECECFETCDDHDPASHRTRDILDDEEDDADGLYWAKRDYIW